MLSSFHKLRSLPYKATFHPPLVYLRDPFFKSLRQIKRWQWLQSVRSHTTKIHGSIEIKGRLDFSSFIEIAEGCVIEKDCLIWIADEEGALPQFSMGAGVYCGRNVQLGAYQPLLIGENSLIGANSYIISGNHQFEDKTIPIRLQGYIGAPIEIGSDVWIGCNVVVLPGVTIGQGAVIAAGAVVSQSVPKYEVWGGVPARKLSIRGGEKI